MEFPGKYEINLNSITKQTERCGAEARACGGKRDRHIKNEGLFVITLNEFSHINSALHIKINMQFR
jgi:hypothetical protein